MTPDRRTFLCSCGAGIAAVAGCLSETGGGKNENGSGAAVESVETAPFSARVDQPAWNEKSNVGWAALIGDDERQRAVLDRYDPPESRRERIRELLSDIEYGRERVLFVESVGPNACYDHLEIGSVRVEGDRLRADAIALDSGDDETVCAEVITFPSALARITFEDEPLDDATVDITDGWNRTATERVAVGDELE